jgi:hypothetical protein
MDESAPGVHQLVLAQLDDSSWRICDQTVASSDPASLVAYVEQVDLSDYLVVWVSPGHGTARFTSLEDVFLAAVRHVQAVDAAQEAKPVPIPHLRPITRIRRETSRSA